MAGKRETGLVQSAGKVIARAWRDEAFKQRLLDDPLRVLKDEGVMVPPGVRVQVVVDTPRLRHLVLPLKPPDLSVADTEAEAALWCSLFWCSQ